MNLSKRQHLILSWTAKILAAAILLFSLPFYFGYGNPLPFINPNYTLWDNTWLTVFPLMFIGLGLGLKHEKLGGWLIVTSLSIGFVLGFIAEKNITPHMLIPLFVGVLYLASAYTEKIILVNKKQNSRR